MSKRKDTGSAHQTLAKLSDLDTRLAQLIAHVSTLVAHVERLVKEKEILLKEREVTEKTMGAWIADRIKSPLE